MNVGFDDVYRVEKLSHVRIQLQRVAGWAEFACRAAEQLNAERCLA
jgi:hypothetical protein